MASPYMRLTLCLLASGVVFAQDFNDGLRAFERKDYGTALKQWRQLAAGDPAAQFNLGLMFLDGVGVPQNSEEAISWFQRAADQGYGKAQYNLGQLYAIGRGVRRDYITAHMWLSICASKDVPKCATQRDLVALRMKARQIAEAQRRANEWKENPLHVVE